MLWIAQIRIDSARATYGETSAHRPDACGHVRCTIFCIARCVRHTLQGEWKKSVDDISSSWRAGGRLQQKKQGVVLQSSKTSVQIDCAHQLLLRRNHNTPFRARVPYLAGNWIQAFNIRCIVQRAKLVQSYVIVHYNYLCIITCACKKIKKRCNVTALESIVLYCV